MRTVRKLLKSNFPDESIGRASLIELPLQNSDFLDEAYAIPVETRQKRTDDWH